MIQLRLARPDEREALSALAVRAKESWGYPAELVDAFRAELDVSEAQLATTFVLEEGGVVVGFYTLSQLDAERIELYFLFVEPAHHRRGHGRVLLADACSRARDLGGRVLVIQGDPHADRFYRAAGAIQIGERESESIPGRMLPLYDLAL